MPRQPENSVFLSWMARWERWSAASLAAFLEPLVLVDLVQVDAVKPGRLNTRQIGVLAADKEHLPRRLPVFGREILPPLRVLRADERGVARLPVLLPVETVVLRLADADVAKDQAPPAVRLGLEWFQVVGGGRPAPGE